MKLLRPTLEMLGVLLVGLALLLFFSFVARPMKSSYGMVAAAVAFAAIAALVVIGIGCIARADRDRASWSVKALDLVVVIPLSVVLIAVFIGMVAASSRVATMVSGLTPLEAWLAVMAFVCIAVALYRFGGLSEDAIVLLVAVVVVPCFLVVLDLAENTTGAVIATTVVTLVTLNWTAPLVKNALVRAGLGTVNVTIKPRILRAGSVGRLYVSLAPRIAIELTRLMAHIVARASVRVSAGSEEPTDARVVHAEEFVLLTRRRVLPPERVDLCYEFPVPSGAPQVFTAEDNALEWSVTIHLDTPWTNWRGEYPLTVAPVLFSSPVTTAGDERCESGWRGRLTAERELRQARSMAERELRILLDRTDRTYTPGDKVSGVVEVRAGPDLPYGSLKVSRGWRTHGKGDVAKGAIETVRLFKGHWRAGVRQTYAFSFDIPNGPVTYRGRILNVDWYISANADILELDGGPQAEEEFIVLPGRDMPDLGPEWKPPGGMQASHTIARGVMSIAYHSFMLGIPLIILYSALKSAKASWWVGATFTFLFLCAMAYAFTKDGLPEIRGLVRYLRGLFTLGSIDARIEPDVLRAGETAQLHVSFRPHVAVVLKKVRSKIVARERVGSGSGSGSGSDHQEFTHVLHEDVVEIGSDLPLTPGRGIDLKHTVRVPVGAAPSFAAKDNYVEWFVKICFDMPWYSDWEAAVYPVTVVPSRATGASLSGPAARHAQT